MLGTFSSVGATASAAMKHSVGGASLLFRSTVGPQCQQVRNNCPWHRSSFKPCYFPFRLGKRLTRHNIDRRLKTEGGRHIILRHILGEKHYITWNLPSKQQNLDRLRCPL
jgi:hypothetical protein